jgi:hypothetical protein
MNAKDKATLDKFNKRVYPVLDLLESYLAGGAYIAHQDGEWLLCHPSGEAHVSGETIRALLVNLIMVDC